MNERLVKLNNAIFNGDTIAQAIQINLVRDIESIPDPATRFELVLDFDKTEIGKNMCSNRVYGATGIFKHKYTESALHDTNSMILLNNLSYEFVGLSSSIIGNADARRASFDIIWNDEFNIYEVTNKMLNDAPLDPKMVEKLAASSGSLRRHFEQKLVIPKDVITLIIVYPNTSSIPLVFGYSVTNPDVNLILTKDDSCIYSSFTEKFEFYDEVKTLSKPMTIGLDTDFFKVRSVMDALKTEKIERKIDRESGKHIYEYRSTNITGEFFEDGSSAEFYLETDDSTESYLLYDLQTRYNVNQYKFFQELIKSEKISDEKMIEKAKLLLLDLLRDNLLCSWLSLVPLGDIDIYVDIANKGTYHILTKDEMRSCNKVITLYGGKFVMIREFFNLDTSTVGDFNIAIFKMNNAPAMATLLIHSKVKFDYDYEGFVNMYYSGNFATKFTFEGSVSDNTKDESNMGHSELVQKLGYHSKDVENLELHKLYNFEGSTKSLITKFDSMFYDVNKVDQIIIRNYLGLPVNHRYIDARV